MKDSHWPVFTNVKTNSTRVKFLTFRSFLLTSFCIGIAVSGLMVRLKAKEFSENPEFLVPEMEAPPFRQPSHQNNTRSAFPRRFGAASSQVPSICNHIPSASRLFPIKNLYLFCENTLNFANGSFRSHHILKS